MFLNYVSDRLFAVSNSHLFYPINFLFQNRKYCRQIYKGHLKQETLENDEYTSNQAPRLFKGVSNDTNRKGELFGSENLLKFKKDGSFLSSLWKSSENDCSLHRKKMDESAIAQMMYGNENFIENDFVNEQEEDQDAVDMIQEVLHSKGFNHEDFMRDDRGNAACQNVDDNLDEGFGETQIHVIACDSVCNESEEDEPILSDNIDETVVVDSSKNTGALALQPEDRKKNDASEIQSNTSIQKQRKIKTIGSLLERKNFQQGRKTFSSLILHKPSYLSK